MAVPKAFANRLRGRSVALRSFSRPPLPQSDARSAAVLVDELNAGGFQGQAICRFVSGRPPESAPTHSSRVIVAIETSAAAAKSRADHRSSTRSSHLSA